MKYESYDDNGEAMPNKKRETKHQMNITKTTTKDNQVIILKLTCTVLILDAKLFTHIVLTFAVFF